MILWIPCWIVVWFYPRYWLAILLAVIVALPALFLSMGGAAPIESSLMAAAPYAVDCAIGGAIVVAIRKWLKRREEANYPMTTRR